MTIGSTEKKIIGGIAIGGAGFGLGTLLGTQVTALTVRLIFPNHIQLIEQCSVLDATLGVALTPVCLAIRGKQSVWVWLRDNDIEMFSNVTDWETEDGTPMIGIEFSRVGYNVLEITARDQTQTFPFVTEFPAIGYWAVGWPR